MKKEQFHELLYQALETEAGGVQVYETAIRCAVNADLKEEWNKYLDQTRTHEQMMRRVLEIMGLDPAKDTPGRRIVRHQMVEMAVVVRPGDKAIDVALPWPAAETLIFVRRLRPIGRLVLRIPDIEKRIGRTRLDRLAVPGLDLDRHRLVESRNIGRL